jgi:hypothetical protein
MADPVPETEEEFSIGPFKNVETFLGAVKRGARPGITAALAVEEGAYYVEHKYHWPGVAVGGALVSEGLWQWQLEKERQEREKGLRR